MIEKINKTCYNNYMINRIFGKIEEIKKGSIVLRVGGIFFELVVANPYRFKEGDETTVYTHLELMQNNNEFILFGFLTENEKTLFLRLISVSGIGPKTAIGILSKDNPEIIAREIDNKNIAYLSNIPRIGVKGAQKIVLELSGKISFDEIKGFGKHEMVVDALKALGYNDKVIQKALLKIELSDDLSQMVKDALKVISNG